MKKFSTNRRKFWGIALLTAFVGAPLTTATAAPNPDPSERSNDRRQDDDRRDDRRDTNRRKDNRRKDNRRRDNRRDDRGGGYEAARNHRGTVEILLPGNEFNARIGGRIYKVYSTESTRDLRVGDDIDVYGQLDRGVNIRNARITQIGGRNNNRANTDRPNYSDRRDNETYTGEVISVRNDREFGVRINGRDYDVYADNAARRVNRGDVVRVNGRRSGDNDIRNARVTLVRNNDRDRTDRDANGRDDNGDYGAYRTYSGTVTDVKNSREYDVRIDGKTYNVRADNATRDLNRGDEVSVYGRRFGDNDIRNARTRITRNR